MLTSSGRGGRAASDCARPASTPSTLARNDQSCVRDARAREATCPPSPARPEEPNTTGREAFLARVRFRSSVTRFRSGEEAAQSLHNLGVIDPLGCSATDLIEGGMAFPRFSIGPPRRERVIGVHDDQDAGADRNLLARKLVRIARAVITLVAVQHGLSQGFAVIPHGPQNLGAFECMLLDRFI